MTDNDADVRVSDESALDAVSVIPESLDARAVGIIRALANAAGDEDRVWSIVRDVASEVGAEAFPALAAAVIVVTFGRGFEGPVTSPL